MFKMYLSDLFYLAIFTEVCDFGSQKRIEAKANPCEKICRISIWISFHSRNINKKTNQLQERPKNVLRKDNSFGIHHKNIQSLAIKLFVVFKRIANPFLPDIFPLRPINYGLKYQTEFSGNCEKTSHFGLKSFLGLL